MVVDSASLSFDSVVDFASEALELPQLNQLRDYKDKRLVSERATSRELVAATHFIFDLLLRSCCVGLELFEFSIGFRLRSGGLVLAVVEPRTTLQTKSHISIFQRQRSQIFDSPTP